MLNFKQAMHFQRAFARGLALQDRTGLFTSERIVRNWYFRVVKFGFSVQQYSLQVFFLVGRVTDLISRLYVDNQGL